MRKSVSYLNSLRHELEAAKVQTFETLEYLEQTQFEAIGLITTEAIRGMDTTDLKEILTPIDKLLKTYKKDIENLKQTIINYKKFF